MRDLLVRVGLSLALLLLGWRLFGPFGLLFASPLVGLLLAKVLMQAAAGGFHAARHLAYADVEGAYYSFRGVPIAVTEDDDGWRWLRVADVRRVLPALPKDRTLRHLEPDRSVADDARGRGLRLRADALLQWLARAQADDAIRFKVWLEREVHYPSEAARRTRARGAATRPAETEERR